MSEESEVLLALMDTLLPGGDGFPAASETGMAEMLAARLQLADAALPARILAAIAAQGPMPENPAGWHEAAMRLEAVEPTIFDDLRKYAYLTYYEQPQTIAAIRAMGLSYNTAPLPEGYATEPFTAERDAPRHQRGRWIPTEAVKPVDLGKLDLEEVR